VSELAQVAAALGEAAAVGEGSVLATVVRTDGSTYRRIGARLVARADGVRAGAVSAGCLEGDVIARAADVLAAGEPTVVTYDSRSPDDLVWGFGLGCGGLVEVLLEPLDPPAAAAKAARLAIVAERRGRSVLVTVIRAARGTPLRPGDQAVADESGALDGFWMIDDATLHGEIADTARAAMRDGRSGAVRHRWVGEELDLAYEVVVPIVRLAICGAGADAVPVAAAAKRMGWHVTLIDDRPAMARAERWSGVDQTIVAQPRRIDGAVGSADCDAAIIMSHNFERDLEFLGAWVAGRTPYIGVLGPRRRTEQMIAALESQGTTIDEPTRQRIRGPVGLDIGAETAEEIALSIVAEVQAVQAGRGGGVLSQHDGPIHDGPIHC
jgi:xanthine/CO dehydrogenase XdhC/CoxF family maturation factor